MCQCSEVPATPGQFSFKINNLSEDTSTYFQDIYIIITGLKFLQES